MEDFLLNKVTSPLRYPGGKYKAVKRIIPLIPHNFSEYREPFVGGGSVFIALKQRYPKAVYKIGDLNYNLFCFWNQLKIYSDEMIQEIRHLKETKKDGRELYNALTNKNKNISEFDRAVRFFVLNRISYSGTVDSGGYSFQSFRKRFTISIIDKLAPLSELLQDVIIINDSYEKLLFEDGRNIFLYLDPPYLKSKNSRLYGNKGDLHRYFNHEKFARDVKSCKHRWLITYDDSDKIRNMYKSSKIYPQVVQYVMDNAHNNKPKKGKEICITNFIYFELIPQKTIIRHSKYDDILDKFISSKYKIAHINMMYNEPYYVQQKIKDRIKKRGEIDNVDVYVRNKKVYLENMQLMRARKSNSVRGSDYDPVVG